MKKTVHTTKVKFHLPTLREVEHEAYEELVKSGLTKDTKEGKSLSTRHNTIAKRLREFEQMTKTNTLVLETTGSAETGGSERVTYIPSYTTITKKFRKCIIPTNHQNEFFYFDIRAAEFFLLCYFAGYTEVTDAYKRGEDIYTVFDDKFPSKMNRSEKKDAILLWMYEAKAPTLAEKLQIKEDEAQDIINNLNTIKPIQTFKQKVISEAKKYGVYRYPLTFSKGVTRYETVPFKIDNQYNKIFSEAKAVSVYVQNALGVYIQWFIRQMLSREDLFPATILTVFDSVLAEFPKEKEIEVQEWFTTKLSPFRMGSFATGSTYYDAMMKSSL